MEFFVQLKLSKVRILPFTLTLNWKAVITQKSLGKEKPSWHVARVAKSTDASKSTRERRWPAERVQKKK